MHGLVAVRILRDPDLLGPKKLAGLGGLGLRV